MRKNIAAKKSTLSVVIACYKDAQAIPIMYERLKKTFHEMKVAYEIIFVNDGSPDDSEHVIRQIVKKDKHVIGISHSRNFGSQMAFTSGIDLATGDAVVLMDGDLQDPPEIIPLFYEQWQKGYDVVYGVRVKREAPLMMQVLYKVFYRIFHSLSYITIPVDAGDFSLIDRKVMEELKKLPERDRFIRGLRAWVGFRQTGVPYIRPERMFGKSTNNLIKNFQWATKSIFSFSYVPLQAMTLLSLAVFFLSALGICWQVGLRIVRPDLTPPGISAVLIVILFLGSVQLLGISFLGEYLIKIFEEVKQRPMYIRKEIIRYER